MLDRPYTNRGEYETYKMAKSLRDQYGKDGIKIYSNLFLSVNDGKPNRQIDHLLLSRRGLFVLETKYWSGTIYHEITLPQLQQECAVFWPIIEDALPNPIRNLAPADFFTLVAKPDEPLEGYAKWHDPAQQVKTTMFKLHRFLDEHLQITPFVHGFVIYAYPQVNGNNIVDLNGRLDGDDAPQNDGDQSAPEPDGFSSLAAFKDYYAHLSAETMTRDQLKEIAKCIETQIIQ